MKTFENGVLSESDGPPLEHDEWYAEQMRLQEQERKERERQSRQRAASRTARRAAADDEETGDDGEPTFAGKPLSAYDGIPDEELTDQDGIGEAKAEQIIAARKRRK